LDYPDPAHDEAVANFVSKVLDPTESPEFVADMIAFQKLIVPAGMINSLAQTLIRCTAPGVPDTYQGTDLWDFSLVDPDNRRPVDYSHRMQLLSLLGGDRAELLHTPEDGRIKLFLTREALNLRREWDEVFSKRPVNR
jgi:(1->4)-alpha-D-glucan 1-alpha-D-glucosylmutase